MTLKWVIDLSNKSKKVLSPRSLATIICQQVIEEGKSLDNALFKLPETCEKSDRAFIYSLSFGVIRWYWQLDKDSKQLLKKPPRKKDSIIRFIILLGIYQIKHANTPPHAAVSATVKCCDELNKKWSKGLVNACLRGYLRKQEELVASIEDLDHENDNFSHPEWLATTIKNTWPKQAQSILKANNLQAKPCLRINIKQCSREQYLELLNAQNIDAQKDPYSPLGIRLANSTPVSELPNFDEAWASHQDTASQLIASFFNIKPNGHVLDACAAPGGKTTLLLEQSAGSVTIDALDIGEDRNKKLLSTLTRFNDASQVRVIEGDASKPDQWWDGKHYDYILIDAPCSGLGVIRRHPDIKHHRSLDDVTKLKKLQQQILNACWGLLKPDGELLYTTCSILPEENVEQIKDFVQQDTIKAQFEHLAISHPTALTQEFGVQTLPGISDMDGFYYCHLRKAAQ